MNNPALTEVVISLLLVVASLAITRYWKINVAKDISLGSVRAFVQLIAVGYVLQLVFDIESVWLVLLCLAVMILIGAQAAASRIKGFRGSFAITLLAMTVGSFFTLASMLALNIITMEARYIIPLGGMIIGNSMNATALTLDRLTSDVKNNRLAIETSLALGKSWRVASVGFVRSAATTGMISILNFMKTVGIVALPGAMTGMILAGADPLEAVYLQIIVAYMLLAAVVVTSIVTVELTIRKFFTRFHQLTLND
ncbi:MAG: iron export ABC transporter permease subunit FetB [bacterium]|nr:iron export ABC transporter permease subunit FetB [bacterium]